MRVTLCVDALEPNPGGIGRYTWELCKGLAARDDLSLFFFGRNRLIEDPALLLRGELPRRGRAPVRAYRRWVMRRLLRSTIVHGPNYFLPPGVENGAITVHDLSVLRYPEMHPAERVHAFERLFADSLNRAAHVITDTETIRGELIDEFPLPASSITAVPLGIDGRFRPREAPESRTVLARWGLEPGRYGLCVSTLEPRKKVAELIAAWRTLPHPLREFYPLAIAGGAGWRNDELNRQIEAAKSEGWLRALGFVDEQLLRTLYAGAALFLYPSIYEGFGLPPLEAMASGVPVMVSGRSCLPEVCGDAGRFSDPDDTGSFAAAIEESLTDSAWRSRAIQRGLDRAARFTWDRCVDETVAIYRKLVRS